MFTKSGYAKWNGDLQTGKGLVSTQSGTLKDIPYSFAKRFEDEEGSNPEELIGAAHAGCFSMALSKILGEAGMTAESIETQSAVTLEKVDDGVAITKIHLATKISVPGGDKTKVQECAEAAKSGCPVSKLFNAELSLDTDISV